MSECHPNSKASSLPGSILQRQSVQPRASVKSSWSATSGGLGSSIRPARVLPATSLAASRSGCSGSFTNGFSARSFVRTDAARLDESFLRGMIKRAPRMTATNAMILPPMTRVAQSRKANIASELERTGLKPGLILANRHCFPDLSLAQVRRPDDAGPPALQKSARP